jgi:hypothetical protein
MQIQKTTLGHIISPDQVEMDPTKLDSIAKWPYPTKTKDFRKFIGFCNYYRKFIHHYADITRPLNNLLLKNKLFDWTEEAKITFENLKKEFLTEPLLITPDQTLPFKIECNASKYAIGAILYQRDTNTLSVSTPRLSHPWNETTISMTENSYPSSNP